MSEPAKCPACGSDLSVNPETDENRVTVDLSHLSKTDLEWFVNNPGSTAASKRIREAVAAALSDGRKK